MKFKPWLAALLLLSGAAYNPPGPPLDAMKLVFDESFDSLKLAAAGQPGWTTTFPGRTLDELEGRTIPSNNEQQIYTDQGFALADLNPINPFQVRDGVLEIHAARAPEAVQPLLWGRSFTSGLLTSYKLASQRYGYFEARLRLPRGQGLWPAFWLCPEDGTWPPEIDVMESIGDPAKVYGSTHSRIDGVPQGVTKDAIVPPPVEDFHTYGVLWRPDTITWYVDRRAVSQQPTPKDAHKPMYVLLNLAVGGKWPGMPPATLQTAEMDVDYVRIWSLS